MNPAQIIVAKRDGKELEDKDIEWLIDGYARDEIKNEQMSAFAMAVYFQGMSHRETVCLTRAMLHSGVTMKWAYGPPKVDKHSTGGIGDKISIPLAPMLAVCGLAVPMISGRGLGTTGGTIDKLESIPGLRTDLSLEEIQRTVERVGCVIAAATHQIAPADKKFYALRDVTGTVPSIPLITASILSKKLAEGLDALILDVKWGNGAFMKTLDQAEALAHSLVRTAREMGVQVKALITDMNRPLGKMIGNSVEIDESVDVLQGTGPADVVELTNRLCGELLVMCGKAADLHAGIEQAAEAIASGRALAKLEEMIAAQQGDLQRERPRASAWPIRAKSDGYITSIDADRLGLAVIEMGGGRKILGQVIDHGVGIKMECDVGDRVRAGDALATIFTHEATRSIAEHLVQTAIAIGPTPESPYPLIQKVIG